MKTMTAFPRPADDVLAAGRLVGRHRIVGKLAEGAHAILYMGEHVVTQAEVAIKVLRRAHAESVEMRARFDREARVMGRLSGCPTIVQVHDAGELDDGRRFLVMEFVRGRELATLLSNAGRRGVPLELERVTAIARDLASALRDAHGKGVVHRDLKPSNIMVVRLPDGREHAKLVDFGVSGDLDAGGGEELTTAGAVIGTAAYMSPEQAVGMPAAVSMDIFALGVVMFEMTTGTLPPPSVLRIGAAPRVATLRADVPAALDALVFQCLLADPRARVGDAIELLGKLGLVEDELGTRAPPHAWSAGRPLRAAGSIDVGGADDRTIPEDHTIVALPRPRPARVRAVRRPPRPLLRLLGIVVVVTLGILVGLAIWRIGLRSAPRADRAVDPAAPDSG